jgi:formyl-CoA transferase/CoA:oxalate CoA-transferase
VNATPSSTRRALAGVRVIELSRILAAPYCGQILADLGADVIKVEMPASGDDARAFGPPFLNGESIYFLSLNRNKDSVTLNLRDERGKAALRRLIAGADVFLHNTIPGSIERLGFDYDTVRELNPRLIYCSISGFGLTGPDRDKPALDLAAQALSGIMSLTGEDVPYRCGAPVSDIAAGTFAALGIVTALFQREQTGEGQMVDTSLLEASLALLPYQTAGFLATGEVPARNGNAHPSIAPYNAYATSDGWVIIAAINDALWKRCLRTSDSRRIRTGRATGPSWSRSSASGCGTARHRRRWSGWKGRACRRQKCAAFLPFFQTRRCRRWGSSANSRIRRRARSAW